MGNILAALRMALKSFPESVSRYTELLQRLALTPGLPIPNPPPAFWSLPNSTEADPDLNPDSIPASDNPPESADVVIIGSGITGAVVAHTLLSRSEELSSIVILDSRPICGGASGRNGGHIKGETWGDYRDLVEKYGEEGAQRVQKLRRTALHDLLAIDRKYCGGKGEVRNVETLDVFYTEAGWIEAQEKLDIWRNAMGENGDQKAYTHELWEAEESQQKWNVSADVRGVIWSKANIGLMNPYHFVISLFKYLTKTYPKRLQLVPHTTVHSIDSPQSQHHPYTIHTSKGQITTTRIIHGTNAHVSHFVPSLRSRIVPVRLSLSAQRPGVQFLADLKPGTRSWCLYFSNTYSFLSQLPQHPNGWGEGELLFGGGESFATDGELAELGNLDESRVDPSVASYLSGALPVYFGASNWGAESTPLHRDQQNGHADHTSPSEVEPGRVKKTWAGIMGMSADAVPWVGKLSKKLTPRKIIPEGGGEWVSAGFSGEGMVHAWACGRALAMMVLGQEERGGEELPPEFLITEERVKKTGKLEQILEAYYDP